jgi:hypothetical protein
MVTKVENAGPRLRHVQRGRHHEVRIFKTQRQFEAGVGVVVLRDQLAV